jgi:hypothetical protein
MLKTWRNLLFALFIVFIISTVLDGNIASAHSQTSSMNMQAQHRIQCAHQAVHLNGDKPATVTCLDQIIKDVSPKTGLSDCNTAVVQIWWNSDFNWTSICFSGNGFANLTDFAPAWYDVPTCHCTSWDDQASSFALYGCTLSGTAQQNNPDFPGYFASDTNGNGQRQYFKWNVSKSMRNFDGSNGVLADNTLSSIYIDC